MGLMGGYVRGAEPYSPHDWEHNHATMPSSARCRRCRTTRYFSPYTGTYFVFPWGVVPTTGEPQCVPRKHYG